jgi:hypothetical protein
MIQRSPTINSGMLLTSNSNNSINNNMLNPIQEHLIKAHRSMAQREGPTINRLVLSNRQPRHSPHPWEDVSMGKIIAPFFLLSLLQAVTMISMPYDERVLSWRGGHLSNIKCQEE